MSDLPEPLTPSDCDLQDFEFMPVMVRRLLKSETWVLGTGDERAASVALWFESWHQVPAASLPSDARLLQRLADSQKWAKVKDQALRGWVACRDGRLYHPVVAEKALEAWIEKLTNSISGAAGNAKRWNIAIDTATDVQRLRDAVDMLRNLEPKSKTLRKKSVLSILGGSPPDMPSQSPPDDDGVSPPDRKGQGEGQGLPSSLRSEVGAANPQRPPSRQKREEITLAKYLENCKAAGIKPVPDNHSIRAWCVDAKIPTEMLQVAWVVFREKYLDDEKLKSKRYKDWPDHFANSVKDRWYGLWITGDDGLPAWSFNGLQRKKVLEAQQTKNKPENEHEHA